MNTQLKKGICIAVGNQKGGVGKTTVAVHLAAALAMRGHTSLLMDLDPSAGSTKHLGVPENAYAGALELLTSDEPVESLVVTEGLPERMHLLPARPQLADLDSMLSKFVDRTRVLDRALTLARHMYDFIILDTPPSAGAITTVAAYSAAEWFLLSAFPHPLSLAGLSEACHDIADVRARRNPELEVLGVVFTNVDGRTHRLRGQLDDLVQSLMPGRRFRTAVSQAVVVPTMSGLGKTVFDHEDADRLFVARQFRRLADEVEHRVTHRDQFLGGTLGDPPGWNTKALLTMADELLEVNPNHA
ncbi:MAG: ParA family protein [Planctomycetota bacterium]